MDWSERDLDRIAARLQEIRARQVWEEPEPPEPTRPLDADATPYESAQRDLGRRERRLAALGELGEMLARELLPPSGGGGEDAELVGVLRALQEALFRHPLAFRGAFAALVAEGRRFGETEEGAALRERLAASPLLPRLRLFGKMLSFSMLEEGAADRLPSAYLEGLFRLAEHPDADRVLDQLFGGHTRVTPVVEAQVDAAERGDPWLELLLGCISLARRVEGALAGASEASDAAPDRDAALALDALLGAAALGGRFGEEISGWLGPRPGESRGPARPPEGLLR